MACCNNECLETVYAECIQYTGELQCIDSATNSLHDIIHALDEACDNNNVNVEDSLIEIDLKCLNGQCPIKASFTMTYTKVVGNDTDNLSNLLLSFDVSSNDATFAVVSVQVFSNNTVITSANVSNWYNPIVIPTSYIDTTGVYIKVTILINNTPYTGGYTIGINTPSATYSNIPLGCEVNTVVTVPVKAILQQLINEVCALKPLIGRPA